MYEYLKGKVIEKQPTRLVLDCGGIGYDVRISLSTFSKLPALGEDAQLLIHFVVREDAQILYGFMTREERELFRLLISVSGIGPKVAITILSGSSIPELKEAIVKGIIPALTAIPGIGKKTAERVIIELREKLIIDPSTGGEVLIGNQSGSNALIEDAIRALIELGYRRQGARDAVQKAFKSEPANKTNVSEIIRAALKYV